MNPRIKCFALSLMMIASFLIALGVACEADTSAWRIAGIGLNIPMSAVPALMLATHPGKGYGEVLGFQTRVDRVSIDKSSTELTVFRNSSRADLKPLKIGMHSWYPAGDPRQSSDRIFVRSDLGAHPLVAGVRRVILYYGALPAYAGVVANLQKQYGPFRTYKFPGDRGERTFLIWGAGPDLGTSEGFAKCASFLDAMLLWDNFTEFPGAKSLRCGTMMYADVSAQEVKDGVNTLSEVDIQMGNFAALNRSYVFITSAIDRALSAAAASHGAPSSPF